MTGDNNTIAPQRQRALALRAVASGDTFALRGEMLVGREIECDITLPSLQVSRYHAKIRVRGEGVTVEDLKSSNGTFVNGREISAPTPLTLGDQVAFDDLAFRLTWLSSGSADETRMATSQSLRKQDVEQLRRAEVEATQLTPPPHESVNGQHKVHEMPDIGALLSPAAAAGAAQPEAAPAPAPSADDRDGGDESTQYLSLKKLDQFVATNKAFQRDFDAGSGPRLIAMTAPIRGKVFSLVATDTVHCWSIGRDDSADICLRDPSISRDHAWLNKLDSIYQIKTNQSVNGVLINGDLQLEATLRHNDRIQLGSLELVFRQDIKAPAVAAPQALPREAVASRSGRTLLAAMAGLIVLLLGLVVYLLW